MIGGEDDPGVDDSLPFEQAAKRQRTENEPSAVPPPAGIKLPAEEDEDEDEDEPLIVRPKADPDAGLLLVATEEDADFDEPLEQKQVSDILLVKDEPAAPSQLQAADRPAGADELEGYSLECKEALDAIAVDPWDLSSWMVFLEEVGAGKAGATSTPEAFERMLAQFPRATKLWKMYADFYCGCGDFDGAEAVFARGSANCWSVELWRSYVTLLQKRYAQAVQSKQPGDVCIVLKNKCEAVFEAALEQVGLAMDSIGIWRAYIEFLSSWPEPDHLEASKKIAAIRKVYHRVLCSPVDGADSLWREYENLERERNEAGAEATLQELTKKHQHSRSILRERRKLTSGIIFDRLATPPTNSPHELQQLELWSAWLGFEINCPDYLNSDSWRTMVRMVFQQCLTCFLHHPEVWLAFSRFEQQQQGQGEASRTAASGRELLVQAVCANPQAALLRVALAELEEQAGREESAKEVLRTMFQAMPSGFSFSFYQRFVRRTLGLQAARRLFSETAAMRVSDSHLAVELYSAHATLELEVNCLPHVAIRVLDAALAQQPTCLHSFRFLRLYVRALLQTGDLPRLRFMMQCALEEAASAGALAGEDKSSALATLLAPPPALATTKIAKAQVVSETALRRLLVLYDVYLRAEVTLGRGDLRHLERLREQRQRVRSLLDDIERGKEDATGRQLSGGSGSRRGLFDAACELLERCDGHALLTLPDADLELRERSRVGGARAPAGLINVSGGVGAAGRRDRPAQFPADFQIALSGMPAALRDLLARLPQHVGPQPDTDAFLRHMRSVTLPPRPAADDGEDTSTAQGWNSEWTRAGAQDALDDVVDEALLAAESDPRLFDEREDDIFRQRQRHRLLAEA